mmetsp:Transcript_32001/g.91849  ORF Transcript_32001/g.91849 Transcript_32001/m.91849 type:complete len:261 (+) Transcript_32001:2649-3431(+)
MQPWLTGVSDWRTWPSPGRRPTGRLARDVQVLRQAAGPPSGAPAPARPRPRGCRRPPTAKATPGSLHAPPRSAARRATARAPCSGWSACRRRASGPASGSTTTSSPPTPPRPSPRARPPPPWRGWSTSRRTAWSRTPTPTGCSSSVSRTPGTRRAPSRLSRAWPAPASSRRRSTTTSRSRASSPEHRRTAWNSWSALWPQLRKTTGTCATIWSSACVPSKASWSWQRSGPSGARRRAWASGRPSRHASLRRQSPWTGETR